MEENKTMSNKKFAILLSSPILAPMALCAVVIFFMLVACGWFFVAMTFFSAASAAAFGILAVVGAFYNLSNGVGAALLMLGCGLCALGLIKPLFRIAKEFFKGYQVVHSELMKKAKEMKEKAVSYVR